ncbi:hypothetical protein DB347_07955 [Opitutaceae bacterium EW11]|nr:hypothetical protein DB347_07955 [Opitutaceae bacterium EW11]
MVLLAGGGIAVWRSGSSMDAAPAAYLVTTGNDQPIRVGWRHRHLSPALPLKAGQSVRIPDGLQTWLLNQDGALNPVKGPTLVKVAAAPSSEREFLTTPLRQLATTPPAAGSMLPPEAVPVTSPSGLTHYLNPEITWLARQGVLYDVAVVDPADEAAPPRILRGVRPPVRLSALETTQRPELPSDRLFAVIVREAGNSRVSGIARFLTARDATAAEVPTSPPALIEEAIRATAEKPMRAGDAWLALTRLPPEWSDNELVLRLRLRVATELGLTEEVHQVQAAMRKKLGLGS